MGFYSVCDPMGARIVRVDDSRKVDFTVKTWLGPAWEQRVIETIDKLPDGKYRVEHQTIAVSTFEQVNAAEPFEHWTFAYAFSRASGVTVREHEAPSV